MEKDTVTEKEKHHELVGDIIDAMNEDKIPPELAKLLIDINVEKTYPENKKEKS